jgi:hypothetical protein
LEREEVDQHPKEDTRRCVDNLQIKTRIQDTKIKKAGQRHMKKWNKIGLLRKHKTTNSAGPVHEQCSVIVGNCNQGHQTD